MKGGSKTLSRNVSVRSMRDRDTFLNILHNRHDKLDTRFLLTKAYNYFSQLIEALYLTRYDTKLNIPYFQGSSCLKNINMSN